MACKTYQGLSFALNNLLFGATISEDVTILFVNLNNTACVVACQDKVDSGGAPSELVLCRESGAII